MSNIWQVRDFVENTFLKNAPSQGLYLSTQTLPFAQKLRDNIIGIKEEVVQYMAKNVVNNCEDDHKSQAGCGKGWKTIDIISCDPKRQTPCAKLPFTQSLLPKNTLNAIVSILEPNAVLHLHEGVFMGVWRYHIVIDPGDGNGYIAFPGINEENVFEASYDVDKICDIVRSDVTIANCQFEHRHYWKSIGDDFCFDDTYIHHVRNGTRQRIVLIVDIPKTYRDDCINTANQSFIKSVIQLMKQR
jgi:beta-hydroxylase